MSAKQYSLFTNVDPFIASLPHKPYCANDLSFGLKIRNKEHALKHKHIQHNPPILLNAMLFDIDKPNSAMIWEDVGAPPPNIIMINSENGHAHYRYDLEIGVARSDKARLHPQRYFAAIEHALTCQLTADKGYSGLIAKNPLHSKWETYSPRSESYTLSELEDYTDLKKYPRPTKKREVRQEGRNLYQFDQLRFWAYERVTEAKKATNFEGWERMLTAKAEKSNTYQPPLSIQENKQIVKSVAKWTWSKYVPGSGEGIKRGSVSSQISNWEQLTLLEKQQVAAAKTNIKRAESGFKAAKEAVAKLQKDGVKITVRKLAETAGISKSSAGRYLKKVSHTVCIR
jgi:hypothetical protein